eukprot:scaffold68612_cov48-Phaeocystis_antarctica.AAC.2
MFHVRSARALWPPAFSRALPVHTACAAATQRALPPPGPRTSSRILCTLFDSAEHPHLVRRQQAAHPLHVGGQFALR